MNRVDFIKELESLLSDIPDSEREEVLQYYNDYLNDAGVENEEAVVESIGTPKQVAASIKAGLAGDEDGEFTESGYKAYEEDDKNVITEWQSVKQEDTRENTQGNTENDTKTVSGLPAVKRKISPVLLVLIIIACIIFAPAVISVVVGVLATIFGIIISILAVALALVVAVVAVAIGLLVSGIAIVGVGIAKVFVEPLGGGLLLAAGILCTGLGLLFTALTVWLIGKAVPALIRFIVNIVTGLFVRKGGVKA